jgi:2-keto-3-deoxy-L-rhamnonate aldolase RhmA
MTHSRVLSKLRKGEIVKTAGISRVMDPWLTEVVGHLGFDQVWLDLEHRTFGEDVIAPISLACRATGLDLMVRVRKSGYDSPMRALEFGANGIMVPHCRSAAEARQWVDWCRFPPLGKRGLDGAGVDARYGLDSTLEHLEHANKETFLVLQIEDKEAVDCVDEIAAVEGVDVLFLGPGDLSISYGVPMQFKHPHMLRARERVAEAAAKAGIWWGTTTGSPEAAQEVVDLGCLMITCGGDHGALLQGLQQSLEAFSRVAVPAELKLGK